MVELQCEPWGPCDLQVQDASLTRVPSYSSVKLTAGMLRGAIPGSHGFSDSSLCLKNSVRSLPHLSWTSQQIEMLPPNFPPSLFIQGQTCITDNGWPSLSQLPLLFSPIQAFPLRKLLHVESILASVFWRA